MKNKVEEITDKSKEKEPSYALMLDAEITRALSRVDITKAKKAAGRADIYGLWAEFRQYNIEKQTELENVTAAFIGWCNKHRM